MDRSEGNDEVARVLLPIHGLYVPQDKLTTQRLHSYKDRGLEGVGGGEKGGGERFTWHECTPIRSIGGIVQHVPECHRTSLHLAGVTAVASSWECVD